MEEVKQTVEMTAEERQEYEAFKAAQAEKKAREQAKRDREAYKDLVDETIERVIPSLQCLSQGIKDTKLAVLDDFRSVIDMKSEVLKLKKDGQRSDTFTNSAYHRGRLYHRRLPGYGGRRNRHRKRIYRRIGER